MAQFSSEKSTVLHRLSDWAKSAPSFPAQRYRANGAWQTITAQEYFDRVYALAVYLESRGINSSDIGAIVSYNCPEWVHMDLALLLLGGKSAGLYPNSTAKDILYILNQTEARVLSVQNKEYFEKIRGEDGKISLPSTVKVIIVFDGDTSISPLAVAYEKALEEGRALIKKGAKKASEYLAAVNPDAPAFMIYTSGTTGNPKGALLSHDNLAYTSDMAISYWKLRRDVGTMFSFLPLCHVAEKLQNVGVGISGHFTVYFCSKFENVSKELPDVQPTVLLCVPRLWEKMMEGVQAKIAGGKGLKKRMAEWALGVGARVAAAKFANKTPSPLDVLQLKLAEKLVISKIRHALGLARAEAAASGAAALPAHVTRWFRAIGLEIYECYGQTESTGVICMTEPGVDGAGTVGKGVPGTDFKLASDGEIMSKGRHVFVGYFKNDTATADTLENGWLKTGDLAVYDSLGQVVIRGRKKEIMKTSGGKMVAPLPIEERLKAANIISQVCLVGDGRKFISALITLSESKLAELQQANIIRGSTIEHAETVGEVSKHVDDLNRDLAGYEQIKRFTVIAREFSVVDGEMTPTLKMKRNVIESRFKDLIDRMYQ